MTISIKNQDALRPLSSSLQPSTPMINNDALRQSSGFLLELLETVARHKASLPNRLDFVLHLSDRPKALLVNFPPGEAPPLILGYSKTREHGERAMTQMHGFGAMASSAF